MGNGIVSVNTVSFFSSFKMSEYSILIFNILSSIYGKPLDALIGGFPLQIAKQKRFKLINAESTTYRRKQKSTHCSNILLEFIFNPFLATANVQAELCILFFA
jgi:hypothetical protein